MLELNPMVADRQQDGYVLMMDAGGSLALGMRVDAPYPASQIPTEFAYWWPDAKQQVARSTCHFSIACSWAKHSRVEAHIRHTILVHELLEQLPVIGVLWGSVLVQPGIFKGELARAQQGGLPFSLWVLIQFSRQPNGNLLMSTVGMRDFEQMEIETESSLPVDATFDLVRKFGSYILANGPVVHDGNTFGFSADHRIGVRHLPSFRPDLNETVYWLELTDKPSVRRPTGFFSKLFGSTRKQ